MSKKKVTPEVIETLNEVVNEVMNAETASTKKKSTKKSKADQLKDLRTKNNEPVIVEIEEVESLPFVTTEIETINEPAVIIADSSNTPTEPELLPEPPAPAVKEIEVIAPAATKSVMFNKLKEDNVFVNVEMRKLHDLIPAGMKCLTKYNWAVVTENEITNIVSEKFRLLKNEDFFLKMEEALINADIQYKTSSINRKNHHFCVDYILNDPSFHIDLKGSGDKITPMIRLHNSYAGASTFGSFGFYREVCSNSLNIAESKVNFKLMHLGAILDTADFKIKELLQVFMNNEYYSLHKKFETLSEKPITDLKGFVKFVATELDLFKFEASEKNPETPSKNAQIILDTITREANVLNIEPNNWLGYNAFNEWIAKSETLGFPQQKQLDKQIFDLSLQLS